jgi:hypothetical protein
MQQQFMNGSPDKPGTRNVSMPGTANMNTNRLSTGSQGLGFGNLDSNPMFRTSSLFSFPLPMPPPPPMTGATNNRSVKYLPPMSVGGGQHNGGSTKSGLGTFATIQ